MYTIPMQYDLIIIGGGPAGAASAVYAARKQLKTLFITFDWGGQSIVSEKIFNWIGTKEISGIELADSLKDHVKSYKGAFLDIKDFEKVSKVEKNADGFRVTTEGGEGFNTHSILIATGSNRRRLPVESADRLEHKGITYCASCDGPLFSGKDVVVIGGGNAGFESAAQLLAYCNSVTMLIRGEHFRADEITVEKVLANPKMKVIKNAELVEALGENFIESITYKNTISGELTTIKTGGVFVEIGQIPNSDLVKGVVELDSIGRVIVDPMNQRTTVDGIWAAGDVTNGLYHQNNIAAGDAVKALEDLYIWVHKKK